MSDSWRSQGFQAWRSEGLHDQVVDKNIETLATALYVKIDDLLLTERAWRRGGRKAA
jgi:hypothetical protein